MRRNATLAERIEHHSIPVTECGCWIWIGANNIRRYGSLKFEGKNIKAHRASWLAYRGEIPNDLHVLHTCDIPECVNPDHLFLGTARDNMQDKENKKRGNHATGLRNARYTHPERTSRGDNHYARRFPELKRGERNGRAKLTQQDALAIRASTQSHAALGRLYGVTKTTIRGIKTRRLWSHI